MHDLKHWIINFILIVTYLQLWLQNSYLTYIHVIMTLKAVMMLKLNIMTFILIILTLKLKWLFLF